MYDIVMLGADIKVCRVGVGGAGWARLLYLLYVE